MAGLARTSKKDIDRAWEALKGAARPRIHTFISTSPLHMKYMLNMEPEHPDVIVSDIGMPVEDGYAFMERVRALAPDRGGRTPSVTESVTSSATRSSTVWKSNLIWKSNSIWKSNLLPWTP